MADQYLLPCECGNNVIVEPRLAGGEVNCSCGKLVRIPTLREMRRLPLANPSKPANSPPPTAQWSPWQGVLLTIGVLMVITSLLRVAYVGYQYAGVPKLETQEQFVEKVEENILTATPMQALFIWERLLQDGLDEQIRPPAFKQLEIASDNMMTDMKRWGAVMGVGALMTVASLLLGGRPRAAEGTR
jgi:hypothetical protein